MRIFIMTFFLLMLAQSSFAARILTMEEAEKIFLENSLEIRALKTGLQRADAEVVEARTVSNPALNFSIESLKNGDSETEETWSLSRSFDLAGKKEKRVEAALKGREAEVFFAENRIAGLVAQMKQACSGLLLLRENEKALREIIALFAELEKKTAERVDAGDIAESALMRLTAEKSRVVREREALLTELEIEKKGLALLLNISPEEFELADEAAYTPPSFFLEELESAALENRPDIRGRASALKAAEASLAFARREAIPSPEIEAGYKRRTGGFSGFVFGLSVPLPLFDRNQGGIARAAAALEEERISLELMKKGAVNEVSVFFSKIRSLEATIADISRQLGRSRELTRIAAISYEEGEAGMLDLLDALRSEKELTMEHNRAVHELRAAVFGLGKATGTKPAGKGGAQ
ncbi:MAG: TolC family protein [Thermodesulfovibrionales bacterium]|jgi:cobalt-zinc-cadmium efflux system outer membrane protein